MEDKSKIIKGLPFWDHLTESEKEQAIMGSEIIQYKKGQMIFSATEECLGTIYLIEGSIRTYIVSEEGREISLFKLKLGEVCVLSASCAISQIDFETEMVAETDCKVLVIGVNTYSNLMKNNLHVENYTNSLIAERFSTVMWVMQQIIFYGIDKRLATFLLNTADDRGSDLIKMTHEEVAREINSAREVVARMLKRFESEGIVQLRRGSIKITDKKKLREM